MWIWNFSESALILQATNEKEFYIMKKYAPILFAFFLALLTAGPVLASGHHGTVVETMNSGGYTYVLLNEDGNTIWLAGPERSLRVGQEVFTDAGMLMENFESPTLNRTFPNILFVSRLDTNEVTESSGHSYHGMGMGKKGEMSGDPHAGMQHGRSQAPSAVEIEPVEKAPGGYSVAELFAERELLAGKEVTLRGRVVKYTPQVMGKNWLHLRDGTEADGVNDITVTTTAEAEMGQVITVTGKLTLDKDLGYGYFFPLIIEDAVIQ
jgi:hypothetical protein